jgi:hypothetical protein
VYIGGVDRGEHLPGPEGIALLRWASVDATGHRRVRTRESRQIRMLVERKEFTVLRPGSGRGAVSNAV